MRNAYIRLTANFHWFTECEATPNQIGHTTYNAYHPMCLFLCVQLNFRVTRPTDFPVFNTVFSKGDIEYRNRIEMENIEINQFPRQQVIAKCNCSLLHSRAIQIPTSYH